MEKSMFPRAAALIAALGAGAGLHAQLAPALPTAARVSAVMIAPGGGIIARIDNKVGSAADHHLAEFAADGSAATLDGKPTDDPNVKAIGAAAVQFSASANKNAAALADQLAAPPKK